MARITLATLKAQLDRIEAAVVPKKATGLSSKADQQTWETKGGRGAARWTGATLELYYGPHQGGWTVEPTTDKPLTSHDISRLAAQAVKAAER